MGLLGAGGRAAVLYGQGAAQATAREPARGNLLARASGLTWALTLAGLRVLARASDGNALPVVVAGNIFVWLLSLPGAMLTTTPAWRDVAVVTYLGCVQIGVAYLLLTRAMRRVSAFEASLILWLEPVANPIWTWLLFHERMSAGELVGAALICAGIVAQSCGAKSAA
jgi:drug/metabolite transporter (DMT)-like permease